MDRLSIKAPDIYTFARQLSGGNQQKTVVAKWLGAHSKVLIFDEPTRGIDINGKREIYKIMEELLEQGVGILMLTSDYTEALEMSHRIIVMRREGFAGSTSAGSPRSRTSCARRSARSPMGALVAQIRLPLWRDVEGLAGEDAARQYRFSEEQSSGSKTAFLTLRSDPCWPGCGIPICW